MYQQHELEGHGAIDETSKALLMKGYGKYCGFYCLPSVCHSAERKTVPLLSYIPQHSRAYTVR
jgi:hypothetical protein